jgi:hypothetical protein
MRDTQRGRRTMTDPIARPGDDDPGIEHATEQVVASWEDATPGKDPNADDEDFARMRRGVGETAAGRGVGQESLGEAAERATEAGGEDPSAG